MAKRRHQSPPQKKPPKTVTNMRAELLGYKPKEHPYVDDAQITEDAKQLIFKLTDVINAARKNGVTVWFNIPDPDEGSATSIPFINITRKLG